MIFVIETCPYFWLLLFFKMFLNFRGIHFFKTSWSLQRCAILLLITFFVLLIPTFIKLVRDLSLLIFQKIDSLLKIRLTGLPFHSLSFRLTDIFNIFVISFFTWLFWYFSHIIQNLNSLLSGSFDKILGRLNSVWRLQGMISDPLATWICHSFFILTLVRSTWIVSGWNLITHIDRLQGVHLLCVRLSR